MAVFWFFAGALSGGGAVAAWYAFMDVVEPNTTYAPPKGSTE